MTSSLAYLHEEFETGDGDDRRRSGAVEPLHTSTVGLDGLDTALVDLASGPSGQMKVLVNPNW